MKRVFIALLIVLLGTLSTACEVSDINTTADSGSANGDDGGSGSGGPAKVGQPVTISGNGDGSKLKVVALKVVDTKPTDQFLTVDQGKRLVAVQFRLTNTGSAPYDDAPSNGAKVIDAKGQQYESDPFFENIAAGQQLPTNVKLAPGNKALGFLAFQVPKKAKVAQVQFSMDSGFGDTAQWKAK